MGQSTRMNKNQLYWFGSMPQALQADLLLTVLPLKPPELILRTRLFEVCIVSRHADHGQGLVAQMAQLKPFDALRLPHQYRTLRISETAAEPQTQESTFHPTPHAMELWRRIDTRKINYSRYSESRRRQTRSRVGCRDYLRGGGSRTLLTERLALHGADEMTTQKTTSPLRTSVGIPKAAWCR